jgi:helix-turn-helix protein/GAF domain-containing protein
MAETFGARLRQRREGQAIALVTIAEQTKIKLSLLEALERDDVSLWPAGIFRRAFVRAYAHAIGLNPDVIVREFLEIYPDPVEVVTTAEALASAADGARPGAGPPIRLRYLVGSAIGSFSRLRRSPAAEDPVVAHRARVNAQAPLEYDLPAAHPSTEPDRVDGTNKVAANCSPMDDLASSEPGLPDAAHPPPEPDRIERTNEVAADGPPVNEPASFEPDFMAAAHLCTELGRVENSSEVQPLLQEAARILDAIGLIVWVWDPQVEELMPALAYGYSEKVLAQLPIIRRDADNATAAAFRSAQTCAIKGSDYASGALVVPLLAPAGCAGVLAIELPHGSEQMRSVRAVATIFAAQLAPLIGGAQPPEVRPQVDLVVPTGGELHAINSVWHVRR